MDRRASGGAEHKTPSRIGLVGARSQVNLLSELAGHHGLHLLFAGGAVVVYVAYVAGYVRRHGWPSFSWRLDA